MAKLSNVNRIIVEDYPNEDRATVTKLATTLNLFMEETVNAINGNIDYDNLRRQLVTFEVILDSTGKPIVTTRFSTNGQVKGKNVVDVVNVTNSAVYPTQQPWVTTSALSTSIYEVKHISGLQANQKYRITLEIIL